MAFGRSKRREGRLLLLGGFGGLWSGSFRSNIEFSFESRQVSTDHNGNYLCDGYRRASR